MLEWMRFILCAALLTAGLLVLAAALFGVNRFRSAINRLHPAGMGDTLGLLLLSLAAVVYAGFDRVTLEILCIVGLFWITSPVCTHLIGRLVKETDEEQFEAEAKEWKS